MNRRNGFTLVELLIALSILSVVIILCASGFKFGVRVWERVDSQSTHIDTLQSVQGFLRRSISHSLVRDRLQEELEDEALPDEVPEDLFAGNAQSVSFVSYSPQYGVDDYLYRYQLTLDKKRQALILSYLPYNVNANQSAAKQLSIIEGVQGLEIDYFSGFYNAATNSNWSQRWDDAYTLPLLVRIKVEFVNASQHWPELVISMRHGSYVIR